MTERTCRNCKHLQLKTDAAGFGTYLCALMGGIVLGESDYLVGDELRDAAVCEESWCERWEEKVCLSG